MTTTQPLDLAPIQARLNATSPGPWWADSHEIYVGSPDDFTRDSLWIGETCNIDDLPASAANGRFIAHARQDVPALLAEVTRLRVELAKYVGHEPTLREELRELGRRLDAVDAVCDAAERQATRWEHPLPVPEWVARVRAAANGETPAADGWVICSPAWLAAGGDCHDAPRRPASDPRYSHEHPAVSVPSA